MRYTTPMLLGFSLILAGSMIGFQQPDQATEPEPATQLEVPAGAGPHEAIIRLRDGRFISGILIEETPAQVVLEIAGVETTIRQSRIARLEILPPVDVRYETWRAAVDDSDTEELLLIAEWLLTRARYNDALAEVQTILDARPGLDAATRLQTLIIQQRRLAEHRGSRTKQTNTEADGNPRARSRVDLLDDDEINLIRLLEIDLRNPPEFSVPDDLERRLRELAPSSSSIQRLSSEPSDLEMLRATFDLRARDLYPQIQVEEDPAHLRRYLSQVHNRWILNSCATNRCHGGAEAGRLALAPSGPERDLVGYTNLLIMDRYTLASGERLINYNEPDRSPLLNMALPRKESDNPHPDVKGFRAALPSKTHPRYRAAIRWIREMHRPRPEYPVDTPEMRPVPAAETPQPADELPVDGTMDEPAQESSDQNENTAPSSSKKDE